jgi:hypothetical protein
LMEMNGVTYSMTVSWTSAPGTFSCKISVHSAQANPNPCHLMTPFWPLLGLLFVITGFHFLLANVRGKALCGLEGKANQFKWNQGWIHLNLSHRPPRNLSACKFHWLLTSYLKF